MARIPHADPNKPETKALADRVVRERGGVPHPCAMLLHSGPVAEGWLRYPTAIRHERALPGSLRELVITRIAHLNGAACEAEQHAPIALEEGLTRDRVEALPDWKGTGLFDAAQEAVLAYCDSMTREIHVPAETFAPVRAALDERRSVGPTATIGAHDMVSRFIEALGIDSKDDLSTTAEGSHVQP